MVYERITGPNFGKVREIFSEPLLGGGTVLALSGPVFVGGGWFNLHLGADGRHILYDGRISPHQALYSVPVTGGPPVVLHPGDSSLQGFTFTPDGGRVVYIASFIDAFIVPVQGGTALPLGQVWAPILPISPDGAWLVLNSEHLYSVPLAGGPPILLAEGPQLTTFLISPDSSSVLYLANRDSDPRKELYNIPIAGGPSVLLSGPPVSEGPSRVSVTADSSRVVYVDQDLFSVPIARGTAIRISHPLAGFDIVREFQLTPDGRTAVYLAANATPSVPELFQVSVLGGTPARLNGPLVAGGRIQRYALTGDGRHVVYLADQDTRGIPELYAAGLGDGCSVDVQPLSQRDPRWSCEHYDHCPATACTAADSHECTIGDLGCALTSLAMALTFAGIPIDPSALNQFMKTHPGDFDPATHGVHFANTTRDLSRAQTDPGLRLFKLSSLGGSRNSLRDPAGAEKVLEDALCGPTPYPVIVKVPNSSGALGHYVLVTGRQVSSGGSVSFLVTDPYPRAVPRKTLDEYRNALGQPEYETVGAVVDPPDDISELNVSVQDRVGLLVTDVLGRRTGEDSDGGEPLQEIPSSSHELDGVEDEESGDRPFGLAHSVSIFQPMEGDYRIRLAGSRPGPYTLTIRAFDQNGDAQPPLSLPGIAGEGSLSTFDLGLRTAPGAVSRLVRTATFASLLEDVRNAQAQGLIRSGGTARSLIAKVEAAAKAAQQGRTETSRNILRAFVAEVRAQSPKHVSPLAAQILLEDAASLLAQGIGGN